MDHTDQHISNVADTSIWVAYYRAKETERPDALFQDPLAKVLIGERGKKIAEHIPSIGRYVEWSVVTRTVIIDEYIQDLIQEGIDTIINLGAGLDTRPYRMKLPSNLVWIEVDYPHIIALKNNLLKSEVPNCRLTRVELDLADDQKRKAFLTEAGVQSKNILVITEGVVPYLTEEQVSALAIDLYTQPRFIYWITEFFNPKVYRHLRGTLRSQKMKKAPFRFYPRDWFGFFEERGWVLNKIRYLGEEALKHGRAIPMPWWAAIFKVMAPKAFLEKSQKMTGYILLKRVP